MRNWAVGAGVRLAGLVAAFSAGDVGDGQQGQQVAQLRGVEHIRRSKAQDMRTAVLDDIYGADGLALDVGGRRAGAVKQHQATCFNLRYD